ncbi:unnamed protein product, partial [Prorocentrum cordatum]
ILAQGATCGPRRPAQSVTLRTSRERHMLALIAASLAARAAGVAVAAAAGRREQPARDDPPRTAGSYLRRLAEQEAGQVGCLTSSLSQQVTKEGFEVDPEIWVERQMKPGSRLITVGDSVVGQMHALGKPGFSCSDARPCRGTAPFKVGVNVSWQVELDKTDERYVGKGWQHLKRYWVRSARGEMSQVEGWEVAPAVSGHPAGAQEAEEAAALLQRFLRDDLKVTADDVMVIGLLGNHFNDGDLPAFERYAELLMRDVVTEFPGRVVVLGTSPQHFRTQTGAYNVSQGATGCAPIPLPSDASGGNNKNRNAIWGHSVWRHMKSKRARFVDMYEMLLPLWRCHRNELDCTHWSDAVISIQVELVLEALKKIE